MPRPRLKEIADRTRRDRHELFEQVYAQKRYGEQAAASGDAALYGDADLDEVRALCGAGTNRAGETAGLLVGPAADC